MGTAVNMASAALQGLLETLKRRGHELIGPKRRGPAVVLEPLRCVDDLPSGLQDRQATGVYALHQTPDRGFFQFSCGCDSWKRFLIPPVSRLFHIAVDHETISLTRDGRTFPAYAFLGVRPCDLKALAILDRVMLGRDFPDPDYQAVRRSLFIVAVNCPQAGGTCFCSAMGAGPRAESGFDLVLDEICTPERHDFIVASGSLQGEAVLAAVDARPASAADLEAVQRRSDNAAAAMLKSMPGPLDAAAILETHFESPHWKAMEQRCLACGNCTLVCPTCFCHTVDEVEFMDERQAARERSWDSCFSRAHSYIHGGSIRESIGSRYRQWLGHKLSTWQSQFGTSGCVGCGRCRTWCPAGIDLIEEVRLLAGEGRRGRG